MVRCCVFYKVCIILKYLDELRFLRGKDTTGNNGLQSVWVTVEEYDHVHFKIPQCMLEPLWFVRFVFLEIR
jgi:hypothetical protein